MRLEANGILAIPVLTLPGGLTVKRDDQESQRADEIEASELVELTDLAETATADAAADAQAEALLTDAYMQYSAAIHSYAFRLLGNQEDADDVTQEVFIRVHCRLEQLRDAARLRPWLYRIATNLCMDHLRRRARTRKIFGIPIAFEASGDDDDGVVQEVAQPGSMAAIDGVAERDLISRALQRMAPKYATCLVLHSAQGLSYREIADVLGITPGAAAVRLARARDMFGKYYEEQKGEDKR